MNRTTTALLRMEDPKSTKVRLILPDLVVVGVGVEGSRLGRLRERSGVGKNGA
jgi:hypothetical protein